MENFPPPQPNKGESRREHSQSNYLPLQLSTTDKWSHIILSRRIHSEEATRTIVSEDSTSSTLRLLPLPRGTRYSTVVNILINEASETLREYVNSKHGSVPWQWNVARGIGITEVAN